MFMKMTRNAFNVALASAAVMLAAPAIAQDAPDPSAAESGVYVLDKEHAYITFSYLHQGYSRPFLRWRSWDANLDWNEEDPAKSKITVDIDASSIDSGVDRFDGHLKSADFFDVENHPKITFVSTKLETTGPTTGKMTGDLTVKGETKPVTLDVTFNRAAENRSGDGYRLGFSARGQVKRTELGVGKYAPFVGDDVELVIEVEFDKKKAS